MTLQFAAQSNAGLIRSNNEDSFFVDGRLGLFIVADGMGGHSSGEVASKMAIDLIGSNFSAMLRRQTQQQDDRTQALFVDNNPRLSEPANHLVASIRMANHFIFESAAKYPPNHGMGTTVVAMYARPDSYTLAWVGDSRIYLIRHNHIQQLTTDHSLVQEQVTKGLISSDQAEKSEFKNILTRALGAAATVEVDAVEIPASDDDYILLCSDGLTRMLPDQAILDTILSVKKPKDICARLIELANEAGGRDNITAVMVSYKTGSLWERFLKSVSRIE